MDLLIAPFISLIEALAVALFTIVTELVALLLRHGWFASRSRGIKRFTHMLVALSATHLLCALFLPAVSKETLVLSPVFSGVAIWMSVILLVFSLFFSFAVTNQMAGKSRDQDNKPDKVGSDNPVAQYILTYALSIAVAFGVLSWGASQYERKSTKERLCEKIEEKVDASWLAHAQSALQIANEYVEPSLIEKLSCAFDE